jgi:hypothetical protein
MATGIFKIVQCPSRHSSLNPQSRLPFPGYTRNHASGRLHRSFGYHIPPIGAVGGSLLIDGQLGPRERSFMTFIHEDHARTGSGELWGRGRRSNKIPDGDQALGERKLNQKGERTQLEEE